MTALWLYTRFSGGGLGGFGPPHLNVDALKKFFLILSSFLKSGNGALSLMSSYLRGSSSASFTYFGGKDDTVFKKEEMEDGQGALMLMCGD